MSTSLGKHRQDWEELAALDPMWAVLSEPGKINRWDPEDFYSTGRDFVRHERRILKRAGLPTEFGRVLDFGCGLGRLTYGWAPHAQECVGVDISEGMIAGATGAARAPNCRFVLNTAPDLSQFESNSFDLVHTEIVLQHLPERRQITGYLKEFLRIARPGGVLYFQLPSYLPPTLRFKYRRPLYHALTAVGVSPGFLYNRFGINPMKMNFIPMAGILKLFSGRAALHGILDPDSPRTTYLYRKLG